MTTKDKIAMILTSRGFSLAEGMEMYDQMEASGKKYIVKVFPEKDVVVWLERSWSDGDDNTVHVMIWLNYKRDFCLSYEVAGAVALEDKDFNFEPGDSAKLMAFFRACRDADSTAPAPVIPSDLAWVFSMVQLTDFMEAYECEVGDDTEVKIKVEQTINGI
mgnify:CR=1 FL=1